VHHPLVENASSPPAYHIAWLISGQVSRFVYKDGTSMLDGGIAGFVGCHSLASGGCPATLDVHIALADTRIKQFYGPGYRTPPYEDGAYKDAELEHHYLGLAKTARSRQLASQFETLKTGLLSAGANHVNVQTLSYDDFQTTIHEVRRLIMARGPAEANWTEDHWYRWYRTLAGHRKRFITNGNMMYLRHLAYASAVELERAMPYKYTHVLYTREDNVFVNPSYTLMRLAEKVDGWSRSVPSEAAVFVDSRCAWRAYSDKIYFANRQAIDVLFPRTIDEHIRYMDRWILTAAGNWQDPLQTEVFFKALLTSAGAHVEQLDFQRTEARYVAVNNVSGSAREAVVLCTPKLYANCTAKPVFPECPESKESF